VCACYGGLTAGLDSRLPASCRGNSGEADDAKPEKSGFRPTGVFQPAVCRWFGLFMVVRGLFGVLFVSALVTAAIACLRSKLKLGSGCVVCCMDLSITPQKGIPSQSNPT